MTLRAIIIAVVFGLLAMLWMHQSGMIEGRGNIYALSTPPVPAIFAMIVVIGLGAPLAAFFKKPLKKKELVIIFMFLVLCIPPITYGVVELLLPWMTTHVYFATPQNNFDRITAELPNWYYPHDAELIRQMYEGSDSGAVPWKPWLYPLGMWTILMSLIFFTGLCLVNMFRSQWVDKERLRFPLLLIPVSLVEKEAPGSHTSFFRNPLVWIAIILVFIHHTLNAMHSFNPSVTALLDYYRIGGLFTEAPWTNFNHVRFFYRPQVLGLAYFVSPDLLFCTWFSFLMQPLVETIADIFGLRQDPGFPFSYEQGSGAYLALIFVFFWIGRHHIGQVVRKALTGDPAIDDSAERMPYRWSFFGAVGGFVATVVWAYMSGFSPKFSIVYVALLLGFGLVYARVRAEGGIPAMWAFPFNQHKKMVFHLLGTRSLISAGDPSDLVMLSSFSWMGRGYYMSQMGYQIENEALADRYGIKTKWFAVFTMCAFIFGCIVAFYVTLGDYYKFGAVTCGGGTTSGGGNVWNARFQWEEIATAIVSPGAPDVNRSIAIIVGALVAVGMVVLRFWWLQSPFHPLGYAISLNYGYALWSNFMFVWIVKSIVQRLGGARLYRQLMPFFLGLVIGDLLAGGISWLLLGIFGPDVLQGYSVQFG